MAATAGSQPASEAGRDERKKRHTKPWPTKETPAPTLTSPPPKISSISSDPVQTAEDQDLLLSLWRLLLRNATTALATYLYRVCLLARWAKPGVWRFIRSMPEAPRPKWNSLVGVSRSPVQFLTSLKEEVNPPTAFLGSKLVPRHRSAVLASRENTSVLATPGSARPAYLADRPSGRDPGARLKGTARPAPEARVP